MRTPLRAPRRKLVMTRTKAPRLPSRSVARKQFYPTDVQGFIDRSGRRWIFAERVGLSTLSDVPDDGTLWATNPDDSPHCVSVFAAAELGRRGAELHPAQLLCGGKAFPACSATISEKTVREVFAHHGLRSMPALRVTGGVVELFAPEGGWGVRWVTLCEGAPVRGPNTPVTAGDLRRAIGAGLTGMSMPDARDLWIPQIQVREEGPEAFEIRVTVRGVSTELEEKYRRHPPANPFANDSYREKQLTIRWQPADGDPREHLRARLAALPLLPDSDSWEY